MHDCIADEIRYIDIPLPKESPDITSGRYLWSRVDISTKSTSTCSQTGILGFKNVGTFMMMNDKAGGGGEGEHRSHDMFVYKWHALSLSESSHFALIVVSYPVVLYPVWVGSYPNRWSIRASSNKKAVNDYITVNDQWSKRSMIMLSYPKRAIEWELMYIGAGTDRPAVWARTDSNWVGIDWNDWVRNDWILQNLYCSAQG